MKEPTTEELTAETRRRFEQPTSWDLQRAPQEMSLTALILSLADRLESARAAMRDSMDEECKCGRCAVLRKELSR